jgi:pyruvate kinase
VFTESGKTARILSKFKPQVPIYALTPHPETVRSLALVWGAVPIRIPSVDTVGEMIDAGEKVLLEQGWVRRGDKVIITAGSVQVAGGTDMLKVCRIGETKEGG